MANIKSAEKRARQNVKSRERNVAARSKLRTFIKRVLLAVQKGEHSHAMEEFKTAQPIIDKAVSKGLIHKNKAARTKSRLNTKVKALLKA